jgi:hypothetical protein
MADMETERHVDPTPERVVRKAIRRVLWKAGLIDRDGASEPQRIVEDECTRAALTAIESAGFVLMPKDQILRKMSNDEFSELMAGIPFRENDLGCQGSPGIKGETVSAAPLQATAGGDAGDRRLPRHFSLHFCANGYGFLSVYSDDIPEFYISGSNDHLVTADIEPVLSRILWENYGTTIAGFCRRAAGSQIEERSDEVSPHGPEGTLTHKINQEPDND